MHNLSIVLWDRQVCVLLHEILAHRGTVWGIVSVAQFLWHNKRDDSHDQENCGEKNTKDNDQVHFVLVVRHKSNFSQVHILVCLPVLSHVVHRLFVDFQEVSVEQFWHWSEFLENVRSSNFLRRSLRVLIGQACVWLHGNEIVVFAHELLPYF